MKWNLTKVYDFFGGVTEFYAFVFTVVSVTMAFMGILKAEFVAAIGAIQAFVTANDVHNDMNVNKNTQVTNVTVDTAPTPTTPAPVAPVTPAPAAPDPNADPLPG